MAEKEHRGRQQEGELTANGPAFAKATARQAENTKRRAREREKGNSRRERKEHKEGNAPKCASTVAKGYGATRKTQKGRKARRLGRKEHKEHKRGGASKKPKAQNFFTPRTRRSRRRRPVLTADFSPRITRISRIPKRGNGREREDVTESLVHVQARRRL
jgi:hypothetical protein